MIVPVAAGDPRLAPLERAASTVEAQWVGFDIPEPTADLEWIGVERDGELLGALGLRREGGVADIHRLVVHPDAMRGGIASALLDALEGPATVSTAVGNAPARALYARYGFHETGEREVAGGIRIVEMRRTGGSTAWLWLVAAGLVVAALSLLLPGAPTYDPWAWIIWGREVTEGDLDTHSGPSWKPLPVLFTTPFALLGDEAAPKLWLVVARLGGLLAVVMAYRLAARLAGRGAGVVAAAGLLLAEGFIRNLWRGFSEALLVGLVLWAVERHLDGRHRQAFGLGLAAALLRPEVWPFWGLYGLWLAWRHPRARALVAAGYGLIPLGWFVPEWIGSGSPLRAAERARQPNLNSAAYAERPFLEVFERSAPLLTVPIYVGAGVALVWAIRRRDGTLLGCAAVAAILMVVVGLMTEGGFAGNLRYVILPAALLCLMAGAGWMHLLRGVGGRGAFVVGAIVLAVSVPFLLGAVRDIEANMKSVRQEARNADTLRPAIERAGGTDRVNGCAAVFAGRFSVPLVAWTLHRHMEQVEIFAFPPGYVLAPPGSALARDPRFEPVVRTPRWVVRRRCP